MKRQFNPTSKTARAVIAAVAVLATALIAASIDGLVLHYEPGLLAAKSPTIVVAAR